MRARIIAFLQALQLIAKYDKAALIAAMLSILTLLAARFGLRLNASDTAYLASFLSAAVAAFTHVHFAALAKAHSDAWRAVFAGPAVVLHEDGEDQ